MFEFAAIENCSINSIKGIYEHDVLECWPSLKTLHIIMQRPYILRSLWLRTPQLIELKFVCTDREQIPTIVNNLPNLEKLAICLDFDRLDRALSSQILDDVMLLRQLHHLKEITFHCMMRPFEEWLVRMVSFTNLRSLKFHFDLNGFMRPLKDEKNLTNLVGRLPHLEHFCFDKVPISLPTMIDVIKRGAQLKTLELFSKENLNENLISEIIEVRKSLNKGPLILIMKDAAMYEKLLKRHDKMYLRFEKFDINEFHSFSGIIREKHYSVKGK